MNLKTQVKLAEMWQHVPNGKLELKKQKEYEGHALPGVKHTSQMIHTVTVTDMIFYKLIQNN